MKEVNHTGTTFKLFCFAICIDNTNKDLLFRSKSKKLWIEMNKHRMIYIKEVSVFFVFAFLIHYFSSLIEWNQGR